MPGTRSLISKEPDNTLHFQLTKADDDLHIALILYPFGAHGPMVVPGIGSQQNADADINNNADAATLSETMIANIDDAMYKLKRNLSAEQSSACEVLEHLPMPVSVGDFVWQTQKVSESFDFISALQRISDRQLRSDVQVHWAAGEEIITVSYTHLTLPTIYSV